MDRLDLVALSVRTDCRVQPAKEGQRATRAFRDRLDELDQWAQTVYLARPVQWVRLDSTVRLVQTGREEQRVSRDHPVWLDLPALLALVVPLVNERRPVQRVVLE